jgi:hypothetical protein
MSQTRRQIVVILWENENGVMVNSIGWLEDADDDGAMVLAGGLEAVTEGEVVPLAVQRIPTANIHEKAQVHIRDVV